MQSNQPNRHNAIKSNSFDTPGSILLNAMQINAVKYSINLMQLNAKSINAIKSTQSISLQLSIKSTQLSRLGKANKSLDQCN